MHCPSTHCIQSPYNGIYLLNHKTYKGHPMYKKLREEQYLYFVPDDGTWNISDALGSANVGVYVKQDVYDVCQITKAWRELKEDGSWAKNKEIFFEPGG